MTLSFLLHPTKEVLEPEFWGLVGYSCLQPTRRQWGTLCLDLNIGVCSSLSTFWTCGVMGVRDFTNHKMLNCYRWTVTTAWGVLPVDKERPRGRGCAIPHWAFRDKGLGQRTAGVREGCHEEGYLAFIQLEGSLKQGGEVPLPPFPGPLGMAVMIWGWHVTATFFQSQEGQAGQLEAPC